MKKKLYLFVVILFIIIISVNVFIFSQNNEEEKRLLKVIKQGAMYSDSFTGEVEVKSHELNGRDYEFEFKVFSKGRNKTILVFLEPESEKNKIILHVGDSYWQHFPRTNSTIILSASSNITGSLTNVDIIRPPLLDKYSYEIISRDENDNDITHVVQFTPKNRRTPYGKIITTYINFKETHSEIYSRGGILLKEVEHYDYIENEEGVFIPIESKITNSININQYSYFKLSNLKNNEIPDYLFKPDNVKDVLNLEID